MITIGDRMRYFRRKFDLSQQQVGDAINISPNAISYKENNVRAFKTRDLELIHKQWPFLCLHWLITGEGKMTLDGVAAPHANGGYLNEARPDECD